MELTTWRYVHSQPYREWNIEIMQARRWETRLLDLFVLEPHSEMVLVEKRVMDLARACRLGDTLSAYATWRDYFGEHRDEYVLFSDMLREALARNPNEYWDRMGAPAELSWPDLEYLLVNNVPPPFGFLVIYADTYLVETRVHESFKFITPEESMPVRASYESHTFVRSAPPVVTPLRPCEVPTVPLNIEWHD